MRVTPRLRTVLILSAFFLFLVSSVNAQQTVSAASLSGIVEDINGAAVPSAKIFVKHTATNQVLNAVSDENGRFRFAYLPVGDYEVACEHTGFKPSSSKFTASIGQALELIVKMHTGDVSAEVDISVDDAPLVETGRTQVAETILPRDVDSLPLNGRNYLDLATLLPGVSKTNQSVDLEKQAATIKHEDITGYMDSMTMEFQVRDKDALALLKEGDKIEFWLETGEKTAIVEIKKLPCPEECK